MAGYYTALSAALFFSFFRLATPYTFEYNSDTAVPILQAINFNFRTDWYYWGQNRFGSCVPFLGCLIYKTLPFGPIWAVAIANYAVLLGAFWAFSRILTDKYARLLLFLILFLPYFSFIPIASVGFVYAPQLLFLGLTLFWVNKLIGLELNALYIYRATAYALLAVLCAVLSVWMSDYSLVFLFFFYLPAAVKKFPEFRVLSLRDRLLLLIVPLFLACAGALLIYRIKHINSYPSYSDRLFVNKAEFEAILSLFGHFLTNQYRIFTLDHFIPAAIVIYILMYWRAIWTKSKYFIALFFLSVFPVVVLHWVYINEMNSRYFTPAYFFLWIALILSAEKNVGRYVFLSILVCLQSATLYQKRFSGIPQFQKLQAFSTLGKCGIIGDYWCSYNISVANLDNIVASAHTRSTVRSYALLDTVLNREKIYLIANGWFQDFPPQVMIGTVLLERVPETEMQIEEHRLCRYRRNDWNEMVFNANHTQVNMQMGKKVGTDDQAYWETGGDARGYVWYGPYIALSLGKYRVDYQLTITPSSTSNHVYAAVDVCADNGRNILTQQDITADNVHLETHSLTFFSSQTLKGVEFRINSAGNGILKIKQVKIVREF
jgi:hypothetical protein